MLITNINVENVNTCSSFRALLQLNQCFLSIVKWSLLMFGNIFYTFSFIPNRQEHWVANSLFVQCLKEMFCWRCFVNSIILFPGTERDIRNSIPGFREGKCNFPMEREIWDCPGNVGNRNSCSLLLECPNDKVKKMVGLPTNDHNIQVEQIIL